MVGLRSIATRVFGAAPSQTTVRVVAVLAALACIAAATLGVLWYGAANDDKLELAKARDAVLLDAQQAAINLFAVDPANPAAGQDLAERSLTGALLDEWRGKRPVLIEAISKVKGKTTATVVSGAVVELNPAAGTARVLVAIDAGLASAPSGEPKTSYRLQLGMTRTDDGWKVSNFGSVA